MIYQADRVVGLPPVMVEPVTTKSKESGLITERSMMKLNRSYSPTAMLSREPSIPLREPLSKQESEWENDDRSTEAAGLISV